MSSGGLSDMKYCENCKKEFSDVATKCSKCGGELIDIVDDEIKLTGEEEEKKEYLVLDEYNYKDRFRDW